MTLIAFCNRYLVLIETLWNVNMGKLGRVRRKRYRINRNIVECKFSLNLISERSILVLIETLWNVNSGINLTPSVLIPGINRNIVECK